MNSLMAKLTLGTLGVCFSSIATSAALVHITVGGAGAEEFGAGYTVRRENECFVITPTHVVEYALPDEIRVTDAQGRIAGARLIKSNSEFDAALLQVDPQASIECNDDWENGSGEQQAINEAQFLVARKVDDNGTMSQSRLFPVTASREFLELEPLSGAGGMREGDSGSALYAGGRLVGMVISVDTATGMVRALTQNQIHGLYGADVLPQGLSRVAIAGIIYRRNDNPYASIAAREFVEANATMEVVDLPADGNAAAAGLDYVIRGEIIALNRARAANPDYERPEREQEESGSIGRLLLQRLKERVEEEMEETSEKNTTARYVSTFSIDIDFTIEDVSENRQIRTLERQSIRIFDEGQNSTEMTNNATGIAVRQALENIVSEYRL